MIGVVGGGDAGFDLGNVAGQHFARFVLAEDAFQFAGLEADQPGVEAVLFVQFGLVNGVGLVFTVELGLLAQDVAGGFLEEGA